MVQSIDFASLCTKILQLSFTFSTFTPKKCCLLLSFLVSVKVGYPHGKSMLFFICFIFQLVISLYDNVLNEMLAVLQEVFKLFT